MNHFWSASTRYRRRVSAEYSRSASVLSFNQNGLEIARVKKRSSTRWLPLWHIVFFIYLVLLIRLVAVADIGPAGYANRMEEMRNGSVLEKASATIMDLDPVSRRLASKLRRFVNFISGEF